MQDNTVIFTDKNEKHIAEYTRISNINIMNCFDEQEKEMTAIIKGKEL